MILFLYLGISSVLSDPDFVGSIGESLGEGNVYLFGYMGYVYPFILMATMPFVFRMRGFSLRNFEIFLSLSLMFFDILIIQAVLFSGDMEGFVGYSIVSILRDFIGTIGVWLFLLMIASLSFIVLFDIDTYALFRKYSEILKSYGIKLPKSKTPNEPKKEIFIDEDKNTQITHDKLKQTVTEVAKEIVEKIVKEPSTDESTQESKDDYELVAQEPMVQEFSKQETVSQEPKEKMKQSRQEINEDLEVSSAEKEVKNSVHVLEEVEENKKFLEDLEKGEMKKPKNFSLPTLEFLTKPPKTNSKVSESEIDQKISDLLEKLRRFKIDGDVVNTYAGPVVTTFEFRPAPHIKVSKILTLQDDLAMALKAQTIRIQAPVPGKDVVGIEIPNHKIDTIYLRSVLDSEIFKKSSSPLTIALGKDIVGNPFVTDLKKLPHLLIAGTTGSGKSVGINAMLLSLLYRNSPETLRLLMIDPKMLEFSMYNEIPHLLTPVITQSKEAVSALANMVGEMERRYQIMSQSKTKNIESYNEKAQKEGLTTMPYIVIIIDELADLMMTSGKDVEFYISRLAQMARAAGIHLLVATQRPSVDVVTGLIKANLPSRISFKVGSKIDSKVIIDGYGAESLLGRGDMLFTPPSSPSVIRLHAPFASEAEIETVVEYLKSQGEPRYDKSFLKDPNASEVDGEFDSSDIDELYEQAKAIVLEEKKTSISYLQRRLQIGYNRSANIIEQLEKMGVLTPPNSKGQREIAI